MALAAMQRCLTELYGLDLAHHVDDFLITDRLLADVLSGAQPRADEELLILEQDGEAEVSLFLDAALVSRLRKDDPTATLTERNLADFLTAFEGVSHFTYFVFKAGADHCVTRLELELQAEIDKFIATAVLLRNQGERLPAGLHHWLFDMPRLRDDLSVEETERYERANHYAARFCRRIWPQLRADAPSDELTRELRYFYRLPREHKIGHIESR